MARGTSARTQPLLCRRLLSDRPALESLWRQSWAQIEQVMEWEKRTKAQLGRAAPLRELLATYEESRALAKRRRIELEEANALGGVAEEAALSAEREYAEVQ